MSTSRREPYGDLAELVERGRLPSSGAVRADGVRTFEDLRRVSSVKLAPWEEMVMSLLDQLAGDAGSPIRALRLLNMTEQRGLDSWIQSPTSGMQASVRWLASLPCLPSPRRAHRAVESYIDLAESARSFRLRGDGSLDPARLRAQYSVELRSSWLRMIGDLLGQVVADAGSYQRAAAVLCVPERRLLRWVQWFVSRGCERAACSAWPLMNVSAIDDEAPYADLADAIARGLLESELPREDPRPRRLVEIQEHYRVRFGPWEEMVLDLLTQITEDAGSIRKASKATGMPSSTLSAKLRRGRARRQR